MFDSQSTETGHRPLKAVPISQISRQGGWAMDAPRSYLVPVLLWFTCGQGRLSVDGELRGYTAHNAIFLPANTPHACQACGRTQGTALFLGGRKDLPVPDRVLHLRLSTLQDQSELNQLVEGFRQDCLTNLPLTDEVLHHRAALISLWLTRKSLLSNLRLAPPASATAQEPHDTDVKRRSASE